jgi:type IV secretion system protein TrbL
MVSDALLGGARGVASVASGATSAYRAGGLGGLASADGSAIVSPLRRMAASFASGSSTSDAAPAWARRMKRHRR